MRKSYLLGSNSLTGRPIDYLLTLYIISLYLFVDNARYLIISEIIFVGFAIVTTLRIIKEGKVYLHTYFWLALLFIFYSMLSMLWAIDPSYVIIKAKTLIQLMVLYMLIYHTLYKEKRIDVILRALLIAGISLSFYSLFFYGPSEVVNAMVSGKRLGRDISQINVFGMNSAITVVLCVYYWLFKGEKLAGILSALPFFMAMASGSRKALLIVIIGIVALLYLKNGLRKIYKFVLGGGVLLAIINYVIQLPLFYTIYFRWLGMRAFITGEGAFDHSMSERQFLINQGIEWFKESPFFGYGLGNYRVLNIADFGINLYAHNNFIELLVAGGIVAFVLYYLMYAYILINLWPLLVKKNHEVIAICTLLLIRLIMDYASVSYDSKLVWIYLAVGFIAVKKYKEDEVKVRNNKIEYISCKEKKEFKHEGLVRYAETWKGSTFR